MYVFLHFNRTADKTADTSDPSFINRMKNGVSV